MEDMDWGHFKKHINSPILTNSRVDAVGFVDFHKVIAKMNATLAFPSAWNGGESKDGIKSWNVNFHKWKGDLDL
jgi:hypothetical protein